MIVKGIVSSINQETKKVEVILPEYSNIVTKPLSVYGGSVGGLKANDFVLVVMMNDDFNDALVLRYAISSGGSDIVVIDSLESTSKVDALSANQGNVLSVMIQNVEDKVPTKTSDLTNDSGYINQIPSEYVTDEELNAKGFLTSVPSEYITDTELEAKDYQNASQVNTTINSKGYQTQEQVQTLINDAVGDIVGVEFKVVDVLPDVGETGVIYLVAIETLEAQVTNIYKEYIWLTSGSYELIGSTEIDLTPYLKKTDIIAMTNAEIDAIVNS